VLVPGSATLARLHKVLQALMLWQDYHLYRFEIAGACYAAYEPEFEDEEPVIDAGRTRLADVVHEVGTRFLYVYDFGDDWWHDIVVRAIGRPDPRRMYPLCTAGERAGPPEDCGGVWDYTDLLALLKGSGEEYDEMLTWLGGDFDPASFDRNLVNRQLRQLH
jgi:hypothetical protein